MTNMRRATFYILIFFAAQAAKGQDVIVTSAFDTSRIFIGDQINYTITVDRPAGMNLSLPVFRDTLQKNIEILNGPFFDSVKNDSRVKIIEKYRITSFDSGTYRIKPVFVETKTPDGLKRYYSDYAQLEVAKYKIAPADSTAKFYDIIGPYRSPLTLGEILPWILLVLIAGVLIWWLVKFIRSRKKEVIAVEELPNPDPAHVIAFRELEKLRGEELWQKGDFKGYYTRLTEILRQYLENRYGVFSLELTTSETLNALVKTGFKKDASYNRLKSVLNGADLVKFAKYIPEKDENEAHFQNAWLFVEETKRIEIVSPEPDKKNEGKEVQQ